MSHDSWKATDPRYSEADDNLQAEIQAAYDELQMAYDDIKAAKRRIKHLQDDLQQCLSYLEKHYDVISGDCGELKPNEAMVLGRTIEWTLRE